jgi:hypothetical protein
MPRGVMNTRRLDKMVLFIPNTFTYYVCPCVYIYALLVICKVYTSTKNFVGYCFLRCHRHVKVPRKGVLIGVLYTVIPA